VTGAPAAAPSVSVVVPTYGHAAFVVAAVESALAQTEPPLEVIVVNDGSPDDTEARLAPLVREGRIRYVRQRNAGVAAARNAGAALARGDRLLFLDDDDLLHPDALARLGAVVAGDPALALVYGDVVPFSGEPPATWSAALAVAPAIRPSDHLQFLVHNRIDSPGQALLDRDAFERSGGFDPAVWGADDWDLWVRLLRQHRGAHLALPVLAYRVHTANASAATARMWREARGVLRRHLGTVPAEDRPLLEGIGVRRLRGYLSRQAGGQLRAAARAGELPRAAASLAVLARMAAADLRARLRLKAHLLHEGRWAIPAEHPLRYLYDEE
jgi:glycosyltransferase involved in cell wall biosynthesis